MAGLGLPVEHAVLGAVLRDNTQVRRVIGRIRGDEFITPVLGVVFDGICHAVASGGRASAITVADKFPAWQVRGLDAADPFLWEKAAPWSAEAVHYADALRAASLRTRAHTLMGIVGSDLADTGKDPIRTLNRLSTQLGELLDPMGSDTEDAVPLSEVFAQEHRYDWVVPDMLERGDRLIVTGDEGGGKTTLLRQIALCLGGGIHPFTKRPIEARRVVIIDTENRAHQWSRNAKWIVNRVLSLGAKGNPAEMVRLATTKRLDITSPSDLAFVHRQVDKHQPDLLMIGPLYRLFPKAINSDDDAAPVLAALDTVRDRGITLIMEAHAGKSTDVDGDRMMAPRGSSAFLGWPEFGFGLRTVRGDQNMVALVKWRGDRDERTWPTHLYRGGDLPWTPSVAPGKD